MGTGGGRDIEGDLARSPVLGTTGKRLLGWRLTGLGVSQKPSLYASQFIVSQNRNHSARIMRTLFHCQHPHPPETKLVDDVPNTFSSPLFFEDLLPCLEEEGLSRNL